MATALAVLDKQAVLEGLSLADCMAAVRTAMIALSAGETRQLPRTMIPVGTRKTFAQMPGALGLDDYFGAKLVSVFGDPERPGRTAHHGVVVLFEGESGHPVLIADAGAVTQVRTAAATAVATDALAGPDAAALALIGCGHQASAHLEAISQVRPLDRIMVWGRNLRRAQDFAEAEGARLGLQVEAIADARTAAAEADIVCTLTSSLEPVLQGAWLRPGTHVNLVGSSGPATVEADHEVLTRGRYFVESRDTALAAASELIRAKDASLIGDDHISAEIGEVLSGKAEGRRSADEITVYKSLGHSVQDLAAAAFLYERSHP
jgi:ornithine cyclodeaminase